MIVKTAIGFLNEASDDNLASDVQGVITGFTRNASFPTTGRLVPAKLKGEEQETDRWAFAHRWFRSPRCVSI